MPSDTRIKKNLGLFNSCGLSKAFVKKVGEGPYTGIKHSINKL